MTKEMVVVTGAGSGIGKEVVRRLTEKSIAVIAIGRRPEKLGEFGQAASELILPMAIDVSSRESVCSFAAQVRARNISLKALVNCAGIARSGELNLPLQQLEENWNAVIGTNLWGAYLMSAASFPFLRKPGGRIINISSIAAYSGGQGSGSAIYAASKAGLHGLGAGLARELSGHGITVNTIAPGYIGETGFSAGWSNERVAAILRDVPLHRAGTPGEIAGFVEYLLSDDGGFMTGEIVNINGGWRFGS
ncbi:MAG: SDR family oxidoreductase [Burkholderiaceae bacterium]